jgi:hypothetical protein
MNLEGKWSAIWIGSLITGLASLVPVIHLACCLIPFAGAVIAVAIYANSPARPILTNQDGIVLGALTGLIGTLIFAVFAIPIVFFFGNTLGHFLEGLIPSLTDLPARVQPFVQSVLDHFGSILIFFVLIKVISQVGLYVIFGILGGLAGIALFRRSS